MYRKSRGFTLVEILIVVIILGILAAIVIPQFTNASNDARNSSVASTLQTLRGQIELFKIQHADLPPAQGSLTQMMLNKSAPGDTSTWGVAANQTLGPYVQSFPTNPAIGTNAVGTAAATNVGWVYTTGTAGAYAVWAVNTTGDATLSY